MKTHIILLIFFLSFYFHGKSQNSSDSLNPEYHILGNPSDKNFCINLNNILFNSKVTSAWVFNKNKFDGIEFQIPPTVNFFQRTITIPDNNSNSHDSIKIQDYYYSEKIGIYASKSDALKIYNQIVRSIKHCFSGKAFKFTDYNKADYLSFVVNTLKSKFPELLLLASLHKDNSGYTVLINLYPSTHNYIHRIERDYQIIDTLFKNQIQTLIKSASRNFSNLTSQKDTDEFFSQMIINNFSLLGFNKLNIYYDYDSSKVVSGEYYSTQNHDSADIIFNTLDVKIKASLGRDYCYKKNAYGKEIEFFLAKDYDKATPIITIRHDKILNRNYISIDIRKTYHAY